MSFWSRVKATVAGWFRREPQPGRYVEGAAFSWRGWLSLNPSIWPRRRYLLYVPKGASRFRPMPLVVLLHGCRQTPEEVARGTRIAALADRLGSYVLIPRQKDAANPFRCWNWFDGATAAGRGEAAIVAAMMRKAMRWRRADAARTAAIGLSAGAALAAILGLRHGDRVRAVVSVAGIACGAAASPLTALTVMKRGPETDVADIGREARAAAGGAAGRVPLLAIQGRADEVVAARNASALVRQYLARNSVHVPGGAESTLPDADRARRESPVRGRGYTLREWARDGAIVARLVEIDGLGHAWSGGDASLPFNDAAGPDATAMAGAFLDLVWPRAPA